MTLTLRRMTSTKQTEPCTGVSNVKRNHTVQDHSITSSETCIRFNDWSQVGAECRETSDSYPLNSNSKPKQLVKTIGNQRPKEDNHSVIGRLSAGIEPLSTLPLESHFSVPKLIDHCMESGSNAIGMGADLDITGIHSMGDTLVALGPGDPMIELWLPRVSCDQQLLQCTIYAAAVHMSAIYGMALMFNVDVITHRIGSLTLLNRRLSDPPPHAVNDITLTAVLRILGQVVCTQQDLDHSY